jgi:hypothetical protein
MQQPWNGHPPAGSSQMQPSADVAGPPSQLIEQQPPQQLQPPQQVPMGPIINGSYVSLELLGTGAFGSVELVQEIKTQKLLAMKR